MYIIVQAIVNRQLQIQAERTVPLGAIRYVGTSTLKDDWFSLGVGSPQEPDPLFNCVFKTEFFTHLKNAIPGGALQLKIADSIEYNKKPGKPAVIKVVKDPAVPRDDIYKSGTIHTGQGEPPNSISRPTPKPRPVAGKAITRGKLLRPGGPGGQAGKLSQAARNTVARPLPGASAQPAAAAQSRIVPQPAMASISSQDPTGASASRSSARAPPPPPPTAPAAPREPLFRAMHDFNGQTATELSLTKNELVIVMQKEENGKHLHPSSVRVYRR